MLLLGLDLGTSSIKASVVDGSTGKLVASAQFPDTENTDVRTRRFQSGSDSACAYRRPW